MGVSGFVEIATVHLLLLLNLFLYLVNFILEDLFFIHAGEHDLLRLRLLHQDASTDC